MARRSKRSDLAKLQAKLEVKVNRLEAEVRQSIIQRIIDLEVVAGTRVEKERSKRVQEMMDPSKFPSIALDAMHETILAMLAMRNPAHKGSTDQSHLTREYIQ